jgi:hypothetical protein
METEDLEETVRKSKEMLQDESARTKGKGKSNVKDPSGKNTEMEDSDIECLKRRYPFLAEFSDTFIRTTGPAELMKMESTSIKMVDRERTRDCEEKMANNKMALAKEVKKLREGEDNRWNILHPARFLGGPACQASRLWKLARGQIGLSGYPALACFDMGACGLAGVVTPKGWYEMANPASCKMALRQFSINNCGARTASGRNLDRSDEMGNIAEMGEFKLAFRAMRTAAHFVRPWDFSFVALESFLIQSDYGMPAVAGMERPAAFLTKFVDYVLSENSNRFRDEESFLTTADLKASWDSFCGAQPEVAVAAAKGKAKAAKAPAKKPFEGSTASRTLNICYAWNKGLCPKPAGGCVTAKGTQLKHICNFLPDINKKEEVCGKDHQCKDFHKIN